MKRLKITSLASAVALGFIASASLSVSAEIPTTEFPSLKQWAKGELQLAKSSPSPDDLLAFVRTNAQALGLSQKAEQLQWSGKKSSLLSDHYYFTQTVNGYRIWQAAFILSVDKKTGSVHKAYDTTVELDLQAKKHWPTDATISSQQALKASWAHYQSTGKLLSQPEAELVYLQRGKSLQLVYKTQLELTQPKGSWRQFIDATSGEFIYGERVDTGKKSDPTLYKGRVPGYPLNKDSKSFTEALNEYQLRHPTDQREKNGFQARLAEGSALVFDPDPRTTLNDETLTLRSQPSEFEAAYQTRTLLDITEEGGVYSLEGPWVRIVDWDEPFVTPSTTNDGQWRARRDDVAFHDAMTYFHLDQSQRYIQSLGFSGDSGIQEGAIITDANGMSGEDNSSFTPSSNRLSFGHGGVPDNEDADVILHEYGHAINFSINPDFTGGDTGAMGEGFGDYWAGSYSYSTPNGQTFRPEWVYTWDGHDATTWPGRTLDRVDLTYDPSITYTAHQEIDGIADYSDQLWSAPLFQSLVEILAAGGEREEVDQIMLEAQFGLGANLKMPEMAASIVQAAVALQPGEMHAGVIYSWFKQVNILGALERDEITYQRAGDNGAPDPGEKILFKMPLMNNNGIDAAEVTATLSVDSELVEINQGSVTYPTITEFSTATSDDSFDLKLLRGLTCGANIDMTMDIAYKLADANGSEVTESIDFILPTGVRRKITVEEAEQLPIPDGDNTGIDSQLEIQGAGNIIDDNFSVDLDIRHTYRGDLTVSLVSPAGTEVVLVNADRNTSGQNIIGNFPGDFEPVGDFNRFNGEDFNGTWELRVKDTLLEDEGTLNSWSLSVSAPPACEDTTPEDNSTQNALYGLAAVILIGTEAGSIGLGWLLLLGGISLLRRRN